ncbi:GTP pyrophosphokinase [Tumebacillus permanentifrigoris]|uniref:Putative GTP pyrophosphokinase n=1 Tax=Tumebacillus permanentifrigoris TaxID=378543 RepID=A0A316D6W5_9BACL|nr:GTP pyrophosphokinase [Tumebacillus permanentifrigoris]PWK11275.1 putative GTP pyrophosphokinase [Tumebacillus permanentifrigoris]
MSITTYKPSRGDLERLSKFRAPYQQTIDELKVKLKGIKYGCLEQDCYSPIEFVVGRVKTVESLLKKAEKKGVQVGNGNWIEDIEQHVYDIAGLRVVTRYLEDIREVQQILCEREDFQVVEITDYIETPKESGYRSVHLVVRYPTYHGSQKKEVLCEIQLRTMSMNFWATNEHELRYKYDEKLPVEMKEQLRRAADTAYELDLQMAQFRREIRTSQEMRLEDTVANEDKLEEIFSLYVKKDFNRAAELYQTYFGRDHDFAYNPKLQMIDEMLNSRLLKKPVS